VNKFRFDVFVSYRRVDGWMTAGWLRRTLGGYRLPKDVRGRRDLEPQVFLDRIYGRATSDYYEKVIFPALQASRFMAVVITPAAVRPLPGGEKNWVQREIDDFLRQPQGANIVPILAGPPSDAEVPEEIAQRYERVQYLDFRVARWRPLRYWQDRARRKDEFLRLVAALFEVPQEDMPTLLQEERRQRAARALIVATSSLVMTLVLLALTVFAFQQRGEAKRQARVAFSRQLAAEARLQTAQEEGSPAVGLLLSTESQALHQSVEGFDAYIEALEMTPPMLMRLDHGAPVRQLLLNGRDLVSAGFDQRVVVTDWAEGRVRFEVAHPWAIEQVLLGGGGQTLVVAGGRSVAVVEMTSGKRIATLRLPARLRFLSESSSGRKRLALALDHRVSIWSTETWEKETDLSFPGELKALAFDPSGRWLFVGVDESGDEVPDLDMPAFRALRGVLSTKNSSVHVVDLGSYKTARTLPTPTPPTALALASDGSQLAVGMANGSTLVFDTASWRAGPELSGRPRVVQKVAFAQQDRRLVVAAETGTVAIWDWRAPETEHTLVHSGVVKSLEVANDGTTLLVSTASGRAHLWDLNEPWVPTSYRSWRERWRTEADPDSGAIAVGRDGSRFAIADASGRIAVVGRGSEVAFELLTIALAGLSTSLAMSHDNSKLALGTNLWTALYRYPSMEEVGRWFSTQDGPKPVLGVAFGPSSQQVAVAAGDEAVLLDVETSEVQERIAGGGAVLAIAFDSEYGLLVGNDGGGLTGWSLDTDEPMRRYELRLPGPIYALAAHSASSTFAAGGTSAVSVHSTADGEEKLRLDLGSAVTALAFSQEGRWLAAGTASGQVAVLEVTTGRTLHSFGHEEQIRACAFSPDRRYLATASGDIGRAMLRHGDDSVRLWDLADGRLVLRWRHESPVSDVVFDAGGRLILASGVHLQALNWSVGGLRGSACDRLARNLSLTEWRHHFGDQKYRPTCSSLPPHESVLEATRASLRTGDQAGALAYVEEVAAEFPTAGVDPHGLLRRWRGELAIEDGAAAFRANQPRRALELFSSAWELEPRLLIDLDIILATCLSGLGGDPAPVMMACDKAVAQDPEDALARSARALARAAAGDRAGSLEDLQVAESIDPCALRQMMLRRWIDELRDGRELNARQSRDLLVTGC